MIRSGSPIGLSSVAYDLCRHLKSSGEGKAAAHFVWLYVPPSPLPRSLLVVVHVGVHMCAHVCAGQGGASRRPTCYIRIHCIWFRPLYSVYTVYLQAAAVYTRIGYLPHTEHACRLLSPRVSRS